MLLKALQAVSLSITLLFSAAPMVPSSMSTDNGGTKLAIDAYSDGAGVLLINQVADTKFDNSAMNKLVFKYGEGAKYSNTTLKNQVTVIETGATTLEKANALKLELAKVVINPPVNGTICDDGNPNTTSDVFLNGTCAGTPISTLNIVDIFGDASGRALYRFENNIVDSSGIYNGLAIGVSYSAGKIHSSALKTTSANNSYASISGKLLGSNGFTISAWLNPTATVVGGGYFLDEGGGSLNIGGYAIYSSNSNIAFNYKTSSGINTQLNTPNGSVQPGVWTHVIISWNGLQGGVVSIYLNGVLSASNIALYNQTPGFYNTLIGQSNPLNQNNGFNGSIDQLRILNRSVTAQESVKLFAEQ